MPTTRTAAFVLLTLSFILAGAISIAPTEAHAQDGTRPVIDVGVVVSDLDRSLQFYQDVIGMTQTRSFDLDAEFGERSGLTDARPVHIVGLKLEDSENATEWKLMSFGENTLQQENAHIHDHTGVQYVTIRVDDLTPYLERIRAHDVELRGDTPISLDDNNHFVLIQDPDGTFVELIGPLEDM